MEFNLCMQPGFLRIIYFVKVALNFIRFIVPIGLLVKIGLDFYKGIFNPNEKDGLKPVYNRIIAAVIVFLVPTMVNLVMVFVEKVFGEEKYNGVTECYTYANLEYIELLEEKIAEEKLAAYLEEKELNLAKADQYKIAYERLLESRKVTTNGVGEHANNTNSLKCGEGSKYNNGLFNAVRTAGYKTREAVVAAGLYLSSYIDVHIPYFWSGGHFHSYAGYEDSGDNFMGVSDKWGCSVKMQYGGTGMQKDGQPYPFGLDCSGFIVWAIYNGGYYTGSPNQELIVPTNSSILKKIGGIDIESSTLKDSKGKVKPGDVIYRNGHVGLVVEVDDDKITIAEEKNYKNGLKISEVKYSSTNFTNIVYMDNFYKDYQKDSPMWDGFK